MDSRVKLTSKVTLSRIVAGCMRLGRDALDGAALLRFVEECLDMGVDTFDHAPVYGGYTVEEFFGDAVLRKNPTLKNKLRLVTKTGIALPGADGGNTAIYYNSTPAWVNAEVDRSLQKLGADHIDLLLVHRPDPLADPAALGGALDALVQSGKVLSVGCSNYLPAGFAALQAHMKTPLVTNQIELSAAAPGALFDGQADSALERSLPLMAWSPLGGGSIFTGDTEAGARLRATVAEIADSRGTGMDTVLYAWLLRLPATVLPVTGTTRPKRVKAAVDALELTLSYDEWYRILAASRGYDVP